MTTPSSSSSGRQTHLDSALRPIYCVDSQRHIVYCNKAMGDWLGMETDDIVGRLVEYHSNPPSNATSNTGASEPLFGLCPPPRALSGEECLGTATCTDPSGRLLHRRGRFTPLEAPDSSSNSQPVLVILEDGDLSAAELVALQSEEPSSDELHRALRQFHRDQSAKFSPQALIGRSTVMEKIRSQVHAAATSRANTLVAGPAGSGRSHVAKAIHYLACGDQMGSLIPLEGDFITVELFRRSWARLHEQTDTQQPATLLLSEADRLAPNVLELLDEAIKTERGQVQIIVTTGSGEMAPEAAQRIDRLATITITMPSLNERMDDLPLLTQMFLESCNEGSAKQVGGMSPEALDLMALYQWPGQFDELRQVVQSAHEKCSGHAIAASDLPSVIHHAASHARLPEEEIERIDIDQFLGEIEKELIERAMREAKGNKTTAAKLLGLNRPRLYRRLEQLGLLDE